MKNLRICSLHFEASCFQQNGRLLKSAVPIKALLSTAAGPSSTATAPASIPAAPASIPAAPDSRLSIGVEKQ